MVIVTIFTVSLFASLAIAQLSDIPPLIESSAKFADKNNLEELFNKTENAICEDPQIYPDPQCYLLGDVVYDGNSTAVLSSPRAGYAGAVIDLMRSEGYQVDSITTPNDYDHNFIIFFSKP